MSPDTLRLVLQIVGVVVGGGILEFIRRMLTRRAELRKLNAESDATINTSAIALVTRLQEDAAVYRDQVKHLQDRIDNIEARHQQTQRQFAQQLQDAHSENVRLTTRIAQLQNELDISTRQLADLQRYRMGP